MKQRLKQILGVREASVVSFLTGEPQLALRMLDEVRRLIPDRRHYAVAPLPLDPIDGVTVLDPADLPTVRIGMAPVLFDGSPRFDALRRTAFRRAPTKILAYNARLERHHLKLSEPIASALFLAGVPLDRIWLRPRWWPGRREHSTFPQSATILGGRPFTPGRKRAAIVSPYFPYPLSHGGAVRVFNLLREASKQFDLVLFAFAEHSQLSETAPVLEFCAKAVLFDPPRYREPRWSTLDPPEVREFRVPALAAELARARRELALDLVQVEYTYMAAYPGDILVEHDVTFDLYRQAHERTGSLASWWNWFRWRRFERRAVQRFRRVVTMSDKDSALLGPGARCAAIPNGVDLDRFRPQPEPSGRRLLFLGSFRHFPNVVAFRFFTEQVWPLLGGGIDLTVVAGPDPLLYWRATQPAGAEPVADPRIEMLAFVRDVRPLYAQSNVVIVPTLESAGTNLKVLEAMAMERAVVSTSSGCAGLGLRHGESVWIADTPQAFAEGVQRLLADAALRQTIARHARALAVERFGWDRLGALQRALWEELIP